MRKKITIKGVSVEAVEMLSELREFEQRYAGAVLSEAIAQYYWTIFEAEGADE